MKVGLIGCGGIAPLHLRVYKSLNDVEIVSLCDLNMERAKNLSQRFGVKKVYSDYFEMLDKEHLDYVDICTPVSTHAKIVCDASKVVPSILVEKPMALSVLECDEIISTVKKNGSKLCIGQNQIFSPTVQRAKALVESGAFNLYSLRTNLKANFEDLKGRDYAPPWNVQPQQRGIIWEVCCHHAYMQLHFLPDIEEVYAVGGKVKYPVYDDFAVLLRTKSERFGLIELSWIQNEMQVIYELKDTTGKRLELYYDFFHYMRDCNQKPPFTIGRAAKNVLSDQKRLWQKWLKFASTSLKNRSLMPTTNLITSYLEAIKKDLPAPVTPEFGRRTVSLLECIEKSLDTKQPVKLT
jgi:predicted dehydrogenase